MIQDSKFKIGKYMVFAMAAGLFLSCTKAVDFSGDMPEPRLVVNCFVEPDSIVRVFVSRSWPVTESQGETFADATVELYINDVLQPPMQAVNAETSQPSYVSAAEVRENDRVKLSVAREGFAAVTAETVVPPAAPILAIDTARLGDGSLRCLVRLNDAQPGTPNYYRLCAWQECLIDGVWKNGFSDTAYFGDQYHVWWNSVNNNNFNYDREPALRVEFEDVTSDIVGTSDLNGYGIFSDDLFDSREYALNITIKPKINYDTSDGDWWETELENRKIFDTRYVFKLVALSPSAYRYLKSLTIFEHNGEDSFFVEPLPVYSNIAGGLGILGACRTDTKIIDIPRHLLTE
ncbi:MAG: DUF4249 domain-containing protein [Tannerella sp.]|nr:DUF4249 domain-containing protein [Tannerella sp.]